MTSKFQPEIEAEARAFAARHGARWQSELVAKLVEAAVSTDREQAVRWFSIAVFLQENHTLSVQSVEREVVLG